LNFKDAATEAAKALKLTYRKENLDDSIAGNSTNNPAASCGESDPQ